jgi:hypothetical protein
MAPYIFNVSREPLVFQENEGKVKKNRVSGENVENPLAELEAVRSLLAIAIAAESRTTPPSRRQYYMETADRMRRCVRQLKKDGGCSPLSPKGNRLVRRILDDASLPGDARQVCNIVGNIIEEIGEIGELDR